MRILVVDDNQFNLQLVADLLQASGLEVLTARSGAEALEIAASAPLDLILMDISLKGMDGLETTQVLKARPDTADIPVVALTAYAMREDQERALAAGCSGFIAKPIDTRKLPQMVRAYARCHNVRGDADG